MRNATLDSLRAIAALAVVTHHVVRDDTPIGKLGTIGVYLFFLISGYCIVLSLAKLGSRPIRSFLVRRAFRLYPMYWVAILFAVCLSDTPISGQVLLGNLTMIQPALFTPYINGAFWTLFIELIFYSIMVALIYFRIEYKQNTYFMGLTALTVASLLAATVGRATGLPVPYAHFLFFSLFMTGGWVALIHGGNGLIGARRVWSVLCAYLLIVYLIGELVYGVGGRSDAMGPVAFFGNFLIAISLFIVALRYGLFAWRWLRYLGEISFGIYLFHSPIRDVLEIKIENVGLRLALVMGVAIFIAHVTNKLVEAPLIRVGRRLAN